MSIIRMKSYVILDASCFREDQANDACEDKGVYDSISYIVSCFKGAFECKFKIVIPKTVEEEVMKGLERLFVAPFQLLLPLYGRNKLLLLEVDMKKVDSVARKYDLKQKDAAYLALAIDLSEGGRNLVVLCTCDRDLARAAGSSSVVKLSNLDYCPL